jgi:RNA 3'-terminal phosphate cyclase-like protein
MLCAELGRSLLIFVRVRVLTQDGMRLQIVRRGAPPTGRGEVILHIPTVRSLRTVHLTDPGRVKRVRGVAYGVKVGSGDVVLMAVVMLS